MNQLYIVLGSWKICLRNAASFRCVVLCHSCCTPKGGKLIVSELATPSWLQIPQLEWAKTNTVQSPDVQPRPGAQPTDLTFAALAQCHFNHS